MKAAPPAPSAAPPPATAAVGLVRGLGLLDATTPIVGSVISAVAYLVMRWRSPAVPGREV